MTAGVLNNDQARKALEQILGTPEFGRANLISQLERYIGRLLDKFSLHDIQIALGGIAAWLLVLIILAVIAGLILVIYLVQHLIPFRNVLTPDARERDGARKAPAALTSASIMVEAEKKAAEEDFRGALRDIYLALLVELGNRQMLTCATGKTDSEYLREITQRASEMEKPFKALVDLFESTWYGRENCVAEDFQAGRKLYADLIRSDAHA